MIISPAFEHFKSLSTGETVPDDLERRIIPDSDLKIDGSVLGLPESNIHCTGANLLLPKTLQIGFVPGPEGFNILEIDALQIQIHRNIKTDAEELLVCGGVYLDDETGEINSLDEERPILNVTLQNLPSPFTVAEIENNLSSEYPLIAHRGALSPDEYVWLVDSVPGYEEVPGIEILSCLFNGVKALSQ